MDQISGQMPPQGEKSSFGSLFSTKAPVSGLSQDLIQQISSINRRLRILEESFTNSRRKIDLDEQNAIKEFKKQHADIRMIFDEIDEMKHQLKSFRDDMIKIIQELQNTAKKEDVRTLEKYIDIWEPVKYVTQNEILKIVDQAIDIRLPKKLAEHKEEQDEQENKEEKPAKPSKEYLTSAHTSAVYDKEDDDEESLSKKEKLQDIL